MKASFGNIAVLILLFIGGMALASLKPFGWINVLGIIGGSAAMYRIPKKVQQKKLLLEMLRR